MADSAHIPPARGVRGPRPMALHLRNALLLWGQAAAGARELCRGTDGWHAGILPEVKALQADLDDAARRERFVASVALKAKARGREVLQGINSYLTHPYVRPPSRARVCLELGNCRLQDFGGDGCPVLLVPSLINPGYIMDLKPGRSFADYLLAHGYRPFLVDWFEPGEQEKAFSTSDYVMDRLVPFLRHVADIAGGAVPVVGYCMGGTLTYALAARAGGLISHLAVLAAPWDFADSLQHAGRKYAPTIVETLKDLPDGMALPVDAVQTFFTSVAPTLTSRKFRDFLTLGPTSEAAEFFVALETWANSGGQLARRVAEDCLVGWYLGNTPPKGQWMIDGRPVKLEDIGCPVWVAAPGEDRLVPQASAYGALRALGHAQAHDPGAGHIGMMVGSKSVKGLWEPLVAWLDKHR